MEERISTLTKYTENSLQALLQSNPDLIWLKDAGGAYLACNQRVEKLFGATQKEIIGRTDYDFVGKELADLFREHDRKAMMKGSPSINEEWVTFADDGHRELLETTKTPIFDAQGGLIGVLGIGHNITDRQIIETELRLSEEKFSTTFHDSPDAKMITKINTGVVTEINKSFTAVFGYTENDVIGKTTMQFGLWLDEAARNEAFSAIKLNGHLHNHEVCHRTKDGRVLTLLASSTQINSNGTTSLLVDFRDISERKQTELELHQQRQLSDVIINSLPCIFYMLNQQGQFVRVNPQFLDESGYSADELEHMTALDFFEGEDKSLIAQKMQEVFELGDAFAEADFVTKSGRKIPYLFTGHRTNIDNNTFLVGVGTDITERKKTEIAHKNYQLVLETTQDGFWRFDTKGYLLEVNRAYADLMGYTKEELVGKHISDISAYTSTPEEVELRMEGIINKTTDTQFETMHRHKDGHLIYFYTSNTYLPEANCLFAFLHDITARKEAEKSLQMMRFSVDRAGDSIFWLGREGNILYVNDAACAERGYSREEMLSMKIFDLDPDYQPGVWGPHFEDLKRRGNIMLETRHRTKDGRVYPVDVNANYVDVGGNEFNFCFLRDITKRKQIEHKNEILILRQQALMNSALEGIHIMDISGNVVEANDTFCKMLGYSREEMAGLNVADFDAQWSREELMERFGTLVLVNSALFETRHRRKDGTLIDVEVSTTGAEIDGQHFLFASSRDITERKQLEEIIRISATAFESQECMMITDANGVILRVNQAFLNSTGYLAEELVGKTPSLLKSGRHNAEFYRAMWEAITQSGTWQGEIWDRRKNGEIYPKWLTISAVKHDDGIVSHYVGSHFDITERKLAEDKIQHLAYYDALTDLPNRRLLMDRLQQALASSARSGRQGALLIIDLDNFKTLNDTLGHAVGDLLLQQIAQRLETCVREGDTVARLGGDEFVVVLENLSENALEAAGQTEVIGDKILVNLNQPYQLKQNEYRTTTSIGATLFIGHQSSIEDLMKQADIAMYQSKNAGRNTLRFFDPQMQKTINERVFFESELRKAIEQEQFELHYQIQVDNLSHPLGAEALMRWNHPERGLISPALFIPLAEETGLILLIGQWVLETACAQLKAWEKNALTCNLILAINVSAKEFRQAGFVDQVQTCIQNHGINPGKLKLELTESLLLENMKSTIATMKALNEIGIRFSLDDFGTGYSSLQYLKQLPLDQLKIDQSFVRDITFDTSDKEIVRTIIAMAQGLNLDVIAEGVETAEQRQLLLDHGCSRHQGYLYGKPVTIEKFESLLKQNHQ